ncbi:uncharacterized protein LOC143276942 isoform X3 [Babylonia areolata]|uniref:uncharacterized protein LOC143276942 isoform X3 n=1 Tax=Babylonia areolata TaxID=304850 RepID=UPI003FD4CD99
MDWRDTKKLCVGMLFLDRMTLLLFFLCVNFLFGTGQEHRMDSCPMVSRHKLPASTSETVYSKDYIYDPLSSSWHSDNGVSITKVRAVCDWEVRADRADHTLWVTVTLSAPSMAYSLLPGDCWTVHDGSSSSFARLGRECEGMGMEEVRYNSSGRSLYLVFTQGEKTGRRTIQFRHCRGVRSACGRHCLGRHRSPWSLLPAAQVHPLLPPLLQEMLPAMRRRHWNNRGAGGGGGSSVLFDAEAA